MTDASLFTPETIGRTPYPDLTNQQRITLSQAPLETIAEIIDIAIQKPPNVTTICALSALCLAKADEYSRTARYEMALYPLDLYQKAISALPK